MPAGLGFSPSLLLDNPSFQYGLPATPYYSQTDTVSSLTSRPEYDLSNLRATTEHGVLHLEPVPLLSDTLAADWVTPALSNPNTWVQSVDSENAKKCLEFPNAAANNSFDVYSNLAIGENGAFFINLQRGQASSSATRGPGTIFTTLLVGDAAATPGNTTDGSTPFQLVFAYGKPPELFQGYKDPGGTDAWVFGPFGTKSVKSSKIKKSEQLFLASARSVLIEWLPIPDHNILMVRIGGEDTLIYRAPNTMPDPNFQGTGETYTNNVGVSAGRIRIFGQNGLCRFQYFPMRYALTGALTSSTISLPFVYPGGGQVYLLDGRNAPVLADTGRVTVVGDGSGTQIQYSVTLSGTADPNNPSVAISTGSLTGIQLIIPATYSPPSTVSDLVDLSSSIKAVEESVVYDEDLARIRTEVLIDFDNSSGLLLPLASAHRACQYSRNLLLADADGLMQPLGAPITLLTGWTGFEGTVRRADPERRFSLRLMDKMFLLDAEFRREVGVTSVYDGWCYLNAVADLCFKAGIDYSFMDPVFTAYDNGPNPANCPLYKLPVGVGLGPRVAFDPKATYADAIASILNRVHDVWWFDPQGILRRAAYADMVTNGTLKMQFQTNVNDGDSTSAAFGSQLLEDLQVSFDTKNRHTAVTIVGLDPAANEITRTHLDADTIIPGFTANVQGFRNPLYDADASNVDPAANQQSASALMARSLLPTVWAHPVTQPMLNLFPFDQFTASDPVTLGGTVKFVTEAIRTTYDMQNANVLRSHLSGRFYQNV